MARYPDLSAGDFAARQHAHLPSGPAWPRESGTTMAALVAALGDGFADLNGRIADLTERESDPAQAIEVLSRWEAEFGLPDPCTPLNPTLPQRRAALLARIYETGDPTPAHLIAVAATLGYAITITEFRPFDVEMSVEDPICGPDWAFAWQINGAQVTEQLLDVENWTVEDPLAAWGNNPLICMLRRLAPAHTVLIFTFT
jgi:uncharacterized protein YmfQ (DUF2313 family)